MVPSSKIDAGSRRERISEMGWRHRATGFRLKLHGAEALHAHDGEATHGRAIKSHWCGREDSNFHGLPHSDLNAARLPIPPRPRRSERRGVANRGGLVKGVDVQLPAMKS